MQYYRQPFSMPPGSSRTQSGGDIWTSGPVLKAVNDVSLYPDSKTFVDQPLLVDSDAALSAFQDLPKLGNGSVAVDSLRSFININFGKAGSDIHDYEPEDFLENPPNFLPMVTNQSIREWGFAINRLWVELSRQENTSVTEQPERHSLLTLPYPAIVIGDRFREVYYWDSYFVIQGLLVSGMTETAKNVIRNLVHLLQEHGLVPNGARTYYLNRSQPPLLSEMVKSVYAATNDSDLLADSFEALLTEYDYWTQPPSQVSVQASGKSYRLARYWSSLYSPRPESFREDIATAAGLSPEEQSALWHNLASGAASGWDFSSRWFADGRNLTTCQTSLHLPADLNAFLYQMETNLADFAEILGEGNASDFRQAAAQRREAVNTLLWNNSKGSWQDVIIQDISPEYIVSAFKPLDRIYASNWVPLWAGLASPGSDMAISATKAFAQSGLIQAGGVLTSLCNSSQQWDAPNAWPPLQYFAVEGLDSYGDAAAKTLAARLAQTWLESNYLGYQQTGGKMVEKYDGINPGTAGGGGEYDVQTGFGWTNGVALHFLQRFGWNAGNSLAGTSAIIPLGNSPQSC